MIGKIFLLSFVLVFVLVVFASAGTPVPYTQDDRDRAIRTEEGLKTVNQRIEEGLKATNEKIDNGLKTVNQRIDAIDKRIDKMENIIMWGFGLLLTSMFALMGFVLWDRRTAISPVITRIKELEEENTNIRRYIDETKYKTEKLFKEFAVTNPEIAKAIRTSGLV